MFKSSPKRFNDIINHLKLYDDAELPFMSVDNNILAFDNGVLELDTVTFHEYGSEVAKDAVARHYIPHVFTGNMHTPLFDTILYHQLKDRTLDEAHEIYNIFLALIGRSFFPIGTYDNLAIAPYLLGESNTGKSTIVNVVKAMYAPHSVAAISATHEQQFGLDNLHDKELIIIPEVPSNLHKILDVTLLQSMISGDDISVAGKYSKAFSRKFRVPQWFAGNFFPQYVDTKGAAVRRLPIFMFEQFIEKRDGTMEKTIIKNELGDLIYKSLKAYFKMINENKGRDFWDFCPTYFIDNRELASVATNWLHRFLTASPDENRSKEAKFYVRKKVLAGDKRLKSPLDDIKKLFTNYMRFNHPNEKIVWNDNDHTTFKQLGYEVVKEHIYMVI
ncbi:hypothetical protein BDZ88DRAFT_456542 [Geranomyces variabilis]|nr:hypothetical protein BDZ88DRAFT_456542 [Geranomyces variabilis]KAJ3131090.1 hypothetical protein HDU90_008950 [Geranomyces variabilis]